MRTVAVIQARMGSTRLPGKIVADLAGRPLVLWTVAAVASVAGVDDIVVATTDEIEDDPFVALLPRAGLRVHRGPAHDVLRRVADAVAPLEPDVVLRQTGDNPFPDPDVMAAQLRRLDEGPFDYVGIAGLPLGIAAEAVRAPAVWTADREATEPADREHVLPFVRTRPERFAVGTLVGPPPWRHGRYTVDTESDLAFARSVAARLADTTSAPRLAELEAIVAADPALAGLNANVAQRSADDAELAPAGPGSGGVRQEKR
jgi:spore coat polysaccharide biosynthesis protein SpsF